MTNYFWLVWYRPRNSSGPKHWALFLTYDTDDQAIGTIYQVSVESLFGMPLRFCKEAGDCIFDRTQLLLSFFVSSRMELMKLTITCFVVLVVGMIWLGIRKRMGNWSIRDQYHPRHSTQRRTWKSSL